MRLRKAKLSDLKFFYEVRNDARVKKYLRKTGDIPFASHVKTFKKIYRDGFFVIEHRNKPVGYVRAQKVYDVSIAISPQFWGKGYGKKALKVLSCVPLIAIVHKKNRGSRALFKKAGFIRELAGFEVYRKS